LFTVGCQPGPRERWLSARATVFPLEPGSGDVAFLEVDELFPRTRLPHLPTTVVVSVPPESPDPR
jgi:hypothetical protein